MNTGRRSTGLAEIDALLGGGLENGVIIQIYGEPASGKTTICLLATVAALRDGMSVLWIDTEGFSIERFSQIAGSDAENLAEHLYIYEPENFLRQGVVIEDAEVCLKSSSPPVGLIVADSLTALYRTEAENRQTALGRLSRQLVKLLGLSRKYNIPVMVTNQVYTDIESEKFRALGGTAFSHLSKVILSLSRDEEKRRMVLEKHRSRPEGDFILFRMSKTGIEPFMP